MGGGGKVGWWDGKRTEEELKEEIFSHSDDGSAKLNADAKQQLRVMAFKCKHRRETGTCSK